MTVEHACPVCGTELPGKYIDALKRHERRLAYRVKYDRESYPRRRDKIRARCRVYYAKNREDIIARRREYASQNKDRVLERQRKYREANRDKMLAYAREYYARKKQES